MATANPEVFLLVGWLILVLVLVLVAALAFVVFQRRRRMGGVIATKGKS